MSTRGNLILTLQDTEVSPGTFLTITLNRFFGDRLPRTDSTDTEVQISPSGSVAISGPPITAKQVWEIEIPATPAAKVTLCHMREEIDYRRRNSVIRPYLLVDDWTEEVYERMPRTRLIAPGASEAQIPSGIATHTSYFARFRAWMPQKPELTRRGAEYNLSFTLLELDREPAV